MQVSVSKREAEMKMDNDDFDQRTHNYRRKKWIEDGLDPDEMENKYVLPVETILCERVFHWFQLNFRWKKEQGEKKKHKIALRTAAQEKRMKAATPKTDNPMKSDARFQQVNAIIRKKTEKKKQKLPIASKPKTNLKKLNRPSVVNLKSKIKK